MIPTTRVGRVLRKDHPNCLHVSALLSIVSKVVRVKDKINKGRSHIYWRCCHILQPYPYHDRFSEFV